MSLNPEAVAAWLKTHPEFFNAYGAVLTEVSIPHPHGDHAVSLGERQILALRDKNKALESRLAELIGFAETNDSISTRVHQMAVKLAGARSLSSVVRIAQQQLKDDFSVPHVALRLWGVPQDHSRAEFEAVPEELKDFVAHMEEPHCGHHAIYESSRWFGDAAANLRSFAMIPLRNGHTFGVLLLASPDEKRFYPDMGTLYLSRMAELIGAAIRAHTNAPDLID
jgi:uncharacterized protein YigA (DUF484 family)